MSGLAEEKLRAREQWTQDPCGAVHDREHEFGTREFFDTVERHRYTEYAPWMASISFAMRDCSKSAVAWAPTFCSLRAVVRAAPASI
jgi:hypothetical protein